MFVGTKVSDRLFMSSLILFDNFLLSEIIVFYHAVLGTEGHNLRIILVDAHAGDVLIIFVDYG